MFCTQYGMYEKSQMACFGVPSLDVVKKAKLMNELQYPLAPRRSRLGALREGHCLQNDCHCSDPCHRHATKGSAGVSNEGSLSLQWFFSRWAFLLQQRLRRGSNSSNMNNIGCSCQPRHPCQDHLTALGGQQVFLQSARVHQTGNCCR